MPKAIPPVKSGMAVIRRGMVLHLSVRLGKTATPVIARMGAREHPTLSDAPECFAKKSRKWEKRHRIWGALNSASRHQVKQQTKPPLTP